MPRASTSPTAQGEQSRPYQSLYRRFRPQTFAEVRGQTHVTQALQNAVRDGRTAHAYLFSGTRGTGKTSTARILAKALNCETPEDGEPCGRCDSCLAIAAGTSFDVHELDAASNNGVEAMRDLVARASLATPGRWKVYIVDEVHMLSTAASNALLKTLEEPPEHVVFVLATTDPQRVLPTIRSRTQHFEFHLIDEDDLSSLIADVARHEGIALETNGVDAVVRRARGSARDALSVLDQIAAGGSAEDDSGSLADIVAAIAASEVSGALVALDRAARRGRDPAQLAGELVERLRADFLALVGADGVTTAGDPAEIRSELGAARCVRAMDLVGGAIVGMRDAPDPRITLEVSLIRAARPDADTLPEAMLDRLERLERRLDGFGVRTEEPTPQPDRPSPQTPPPPVPPPPVPPPPVPPPPVPQPGPPPPQPSPPSPVPDPEPPPTGPPYIGTTPIAAPVPPDYAAAAAAPPRDDLVAAWGDEILPKLRPKLRAIYQAGRFLEPDGPDAVLALPNQAHIEHAEPLRGEVAEELSRHFGRRIGVRLVADPGPARPLSELRQSPDPSATTPVSSDEEDELVAETRAARAEPDAPQQSVAPSGLDVIEGRLLEAFPGAEEV